MIDLTDITTLKKELEEMTADRNNLRQQLYDANFELRTLRELCREYQLKEIKNENRRRAYRKLNAENQKTP